MKIAMLHGPRDLRIEEQPFDTSSFQPHEIWVETRISALKIGTDRGNYEGAERVPGAPDYPRWVGDSNLGIVRGVGSAVTPGAGGRPHRDTAATSVRVHYHRRCEHGQGARECR